MAEQSAHLLWLSLQILLRQLHVFLASDKKGYPLMEPFRLYLQNRFLSVASIAACFFGNKGQGICLTHEAEFAVRLFGVSGVCRIHEDAAFQEIPVKV